MRHNGFCQSSSGKQIGRDVSYCKLLVMNAVAEMIVRLVLDSSFSIKEVRNMAG